MLMLEVIHRLNLLFAFASNAKRGEYSKIEKNKRNREE